MYGQLNTIEAILEVIVNQPGSDLYFVAEELDMSKSGVHKHLATLLHLGHLRRTGGKYYVGFQPLLLGAESLSQFPLYREIISNLDKMAHTTGFEWYLRYL